MFGKPGQFVPPDLVVHEKADAVRIVERGAELPLHIRFDRSLKTRFEYVIKVVGRGAEQR